MMKIDSSLSYVKEKLFSCKIFVVLIFTSILFSILLLLASILTFEYFFSWEYYYMYDGIDSILEIPDDFDAFLLRTYHFKNETLYRYRSKHSILKKNNDFLDSVMFFDEEEEDVVVVVTATPHYDDVEELWMDCQGVCDCYMEEEDERRSLGLANLVFSHRYASIIFVSMFGLAVARFVDEHAMDCYDRARTILGWDTPISCHMSDVVCNEGAILEELIDESTPPLTGETENQGQQQQPEGTNVIDEEEEESVEIEEEVEELEGDKEIVYYKCHGNCVFNTMARIKNDGIFDKCEDFQCGPMKVGIRDVGPETDSLVKRVFLRNYLNPFCLMRNAFQIDEIDRRPLSDRMSYLCLGTNAEVEAKDLSNIECRRLTEVKKERQREKKEKLQKMEKKKRKRKRKKKKN